MRYVCKKIFCPNVLEIFVWIVVCGVYSQELVSIILM